MKWSYRVMAVLCTSWSSDALLEAFNASLAANIEEVMRRQEYQGCHWGIQARRADSSIDEIIYETPGAYQYAVPASNNKVPSTFAAWLSLGPDYHFSTALGASVSEDGKSANVTLCGANDPSLTSAQVCFVPLLLSLQLTSACGA